MKPTFRSLAAILLVGAALAFANCAAADPIEFTLDYANTVGSYINFDGKSHFSFATAKNNLQITSDGTAAGLLGEITGTYTIGSVVTSGMLSTASVSGAGTFVIHDGHGFNLTGTLVWDNMLQFGTGDFLNTAGLVNLTNITYAGLNPALRTFAVGDHSATDVLSFQFGSTKKLSVLKTASAKTSFSGELSAFRTPDVANTFLLGLGAFAGLLALRRRRS